MFIMDLAFASPLHEVSAVNNLVLNIKRDKPKATNYSMNMLPGDLKVKVRLRLDDKIRYYSTVKSKTVKGM